MLERRGGKPDISGRLVRRQRAIVCTHTQHTRMHARRSASAHITELVEGSRGSGKRAQGQTCHQGRDSSSPPQRGGCVTPTLSSHRGNARLTGSLSAGAREEVKTPFVGLEREGRAMKSSHALLVREGGLSDVTRIPLAKESALRQGGRVDPEPHVTAQKKTLRKLNNNNSKLKLRFHSGPRGPDLS